METINKIYLYLSDIEILILRPHWLHFGALGFIHLYRSILHCSHKSDYYPNVVYKVMKSCISGFHIFFILFVCRGLNIVFKNSSTMVRMVTFNVLSIQISFVMHSESSSQMNMIMSVFAFKICNYACVGCEPYAHNSCYLLYTQSNHFPRPIMYSWLESQLFVFVDHIF